MDQEHDHAGPWWAIGILIIALYAGWYGYMLGSMNQINNAYARIQRIERQLECPPASVAVKDYEGNKYCYEVER